jgi:hypothetical protein
MSRVLHIHPTKDGHITDEVMIVSRLDGNIHRKQLMQRDAVFALLAHPAFRNHYDDVVHHMDKLGSHLYAV